MCVVTLLTPRSRSTIFILCYIVWTIFFDQEMWSMFFPIFEKSITNVSLHIFDFYASAMSDGGACLLFSKFNIMSITPIIALYYVKVSRPVSAHIPWPRAIPSISYPGINITKSVKMLNSYFTAWRVLLCVVNGFSLVMNCADVIMMRADCQSDIDLRLASFWIWSAVN